MDDGTTSSSLSFSPFEHSRRSSSVDSCRLFGVMRLGFLVMWWDLVSDASDIGKGSTMMTTAPGIEQGAHV